MWMCENCGSKFEEPDVEYDETFDGEGDYCYQACPDCGSSNVEEINNDQKE